MHTIAGIAYIEITDDMYRKLHEEVHRTCVSPKRLLESRGDAPAGLRLLTVSNWYLGKLRSAEKLHWDYVMARYTELPDADRG